MSTQPAIDLALRALEGAFNGDFDGRLVSSAITGLMDLQSREAAEWVSPADAEPSHGQRVALRLLDSSVLRQCRLTIGGWYWSLQRIRDERIVGWKPEASDDGLR